ncbi:hypothetical protein [Bacillus sp. FSL W8-0940]
MEIQKKIEIAQEIMNLAKEKGWSEEELAKALYLLHSNIESSCY